ncbi:MAG: sigma-54-dependent Fis family transcriptional regulator [Elusimicrobia bacterium]|nr:sigma-54-dependent Fis family transcriptional regulator [Elusimicrobiota bacterium]
MMTQTNVLIVDDDQELCGVLKNFLEAKGYRTFIAADAAAGLGILEKETIGLALLDLTLGGMPGMELLKEIKAEDPGLPVVILTGDAEVQTAVAAIKAGAANYITKPITNEGLLVSMEKALRERDLAREVEALRTQVKNLDPCGEFLGSSPVVRRLIEQAKQVAGTDIAVLIQGESGTGKELLARLIHKWSSRQDGPFVALDCGAIPESLVESELFGHEKGAFTGADTKKPGLFELAFRGTLFLDEAGNLSLPIQAKLLRALETRQLRHLGGKKDIFTDVRVLAASNRDLKKAAADGSFRQDLYYRLNQFELKAPLLRERPQDISLLAGHFLKLANKELKKSVAAIHPQAMQWLQKQAWPGNVRELKSAVTKACLLADKIIQPEHFAQAPERQGGQVSTSTSSRRSRSRDLTPLTLTLAGQEKEIILKALEKTGGNKRQAAKTLGIHRSVLYYKLHKLGIH